MICCAEKKEKKKKKKAKKRKKKKAKKEKKEKLSRAEFLLSQEGLSFSELKLLLLERAPIFQTDVLFITAFKNWLGSGPGDPWRGKPGGSYSVRARLGPRLHADG